MAILRRADYFILIWTCSAVLPVSRYCHFSKLSPIQNKTHKKQERSFVLLPCCARKRCLLSCMVGLVQLPDPTRVICFQGTLTRCRRCNLYGINRGPYEVCRDGPPYAEPIMPTLGCPNDELSGSGATGGRSPHRADNPHRSLPPISASPCCQMSCGCRG